MGPTHEDGYRSGQGRHDGGLLCRLCVDTLPREDNDWCPAAGCVVCEDCCRAMMLGETRLLEAASDVSGRQLSLEDVICECTGCARLVRLVTERTQDEVPAARFPLH